MTHQAQPNPLAQFYRVPALTVNLPTRGATYSPEDVQLNDDGGLAILPMTANDESVLKNPDLVLSGEAVLQVIRSCVPGVKNPRRLLSCDIDALLVGIRAASFGKDRELEAECPECKHENRYGVDYEMLLEAVSPVDTRREVILSNGVSVFVSPSTFDSRTKQAKAMFEGSKMDRAVRNSAMDDETRFKVFGEAFKKVVKINFELIMEAIREVEVAGEDGNTVTVTDRKHIAEFLRNISREDVDRIEQAVTELNTHGVTRDMDAVCQNCGHQWKLPIEVNETNFF